MNKIIFNNDFPEIIKPQVGSILNDFDWLLPAWLQTLYVGYHADEQEASAYISVNKDYRFANLKVCGHWVNESAELQKEQILHELIHLYNVPIKRYALDMFEIHCEGGKDGVIYKMIKNQLVSKNESATSDMTFALMNKFHHADKPAQ